MRRTEYGNIRGETRTFHCPYYLWEAVRASIKDCYSVGEFIRMAITDKLERDFNYIDLRKVKK
jgi:hypothetical protein